MKTALRENIDWVGYVDWNERDFHSFVAERGITYNAYLVRDEKTALIDAVKEPFAADLIRNVSALTDPSKIDYVVCNHAEPDHAGALGHVIKAAPKATLLCTEKCAGILAAHMDTSGWKIQTVAEGETVSLGKRTLQFIETPMVHWPESMFTYIPEEKLLFSMDAFGQHYATSARFDDEVPLCTAMEELKSYYANIIMPFGRNVARVMDKIRELETEIIAPAHGIIWRKYIAGVLEAYDHWAAFRARPKVLILYDTMWKSTDEMARAILEGASQPGIEARLIHVRRNSLTDIATEVLDAAVIAFGSPTINRGMMPAAAAVLTYLAGLKPAKKAAMAFGTYGWSKGGPEAVEEGLKAVKWEILRDPLRSQYRPTAELLNECREAGMMLAEKAKEFGSDRRAAVRTCVDP